MRVVAVSGCGRASGEYQASRAIRGEFTATSEADRWPENVRDHVGKIVAAAVAGELVHAHQVLDLGLAAGLFADVADDGVEGALICADLATGKAPEPVTVALLAEQDSAGLVGDDGPDGRG